MNQVAELLKRSNMKVSELSRLIDVPVSTLYSIRDAESLDRASVAVVLKIAHAFGLTVEELMTGKPSEQESRIIYSIVHLNEAGRMKVAEYASDLAVNPKYRSETQVWAFNEGEFAQVYPFE